MTDPPKSAPGALLKDLVRHVAFVLEGHRFSSTAGKHHKEVAGEIVDFVASAYKPASDATRKDLEPLCLKAICPADYRCACANKDWKWRNDLCEADMARVKAILDCVFLALPPVIDKTKLYTVLSKSIPADMIDGIWQELNQ